MAKKKFGFSFSLKRALGISGAKSKFSRKTKIPLTKFGRQRKAGQALGCCLPLAVFVILTALILII